MKKVLGTILAAAFTVVLSSVFISCPDEISGISSTPQTEGTSGNQGNGSSGTTTGGGNSGTTITTTYSSPAGGTYKIAEITDGGKTYSMDGTTLTIKSSGFPNITITKNADGTYTGKNGGVDTTVTEEQQTEYQEYFPRFNETLSFSSSGNSVSGTEGSAEASPVSGTYEVSGTTVTIKIPKFGSSTTGSTSDSWVTIVLSGKNWSQTYKRQ